MNELRCYGLFYRDAKIRWALAEATSVVHQRIAVLPGAIEEGCVVCPYV